MPVNVPVPLSLVVTLARRVKDSVCTVGQLAAKTDRDYFALKWFYRNQSSGTRPLHSDEPGEDCKVRTRLFRSGRYEFGFHNVNWSIHGSEVLQRNYSEKIFLLVGSVSHAQFLSSLPVLRICPFRMSVDDLQALCICSLVVSFLNFQG